MWGGHSLRQALPATAGAIPEAGRDWSASQFSTKVLRFAVGELSRARVPAPHSPWVSHCDQISVQPTIRSITRWLTEMPNAHPLRAPSTVAYRFPASCNFRERASIGCDGFRNSLAIHELPFAPAGDEVGFAENLEMVRDSRRCDATHRDNLATVHVVSCRDGLKDPEASLVGQSFRYFLDLRSVHSQFRV